MKKELLTLMSASFLATGSMIVSSNFLPVNAGTISLLNVPVNTGDPLGKRGIKSNSHF